MLRFGLGARPGELAEASRDPRGWLLQQTQSPAPLAVPATLAPSYEIFPAYLAAREQRRNIKLGVDIDSDAKAVNVRRAAYQAHYQAQVLARARSATLTTRPFAERLVHFWSNHFAVSADKGIVYGLAGTLENEAIRPNVNGRFVDLLLAVERHPAMIAFLDNQFSTGAGSDVAQWTASGAAPPKRLFGINENLAREVLELHTLGVNGGYTQADVTAFAQVLTGWSIGGGQGRFAGGEPGRFFFREHLHQPGARTLLGRTYPAQGQAQGEAVLRDLARHQATAHFLATKLTRHFVSDDPPPETVKRVARAFLQGDGHLPQVYAALIDAPQSWQPAAVKFKTPEDFVFSTLRALQLTPQRPEEVVRTFDLLGQRQYTPGSPAGWPDTAGNWDGADSLMHRVLWASRMAARYESGADPGDVAVSSLGTYGRADTRLAMQRATSGTQALTLLLMSPEFQRR